MITRLIYTQIWTDNYFIELSPQEKLLFFYFLTNDQVNIIHLYRCPINRIVADTGIDRGIVVEAKKKFEKAGKMCFKEEFVFLRNAHRFEKYEGEKNIRAKEKLFSRLSQSIIDWYNSNLDTPMHTPYKSEVITHKTEYIDPDTIPI